MGQSTRRLRFGSYQFLLCGGRSEELSECPLHSVVILAICRAGKSFEALASRRCLSPFPCARLRGQVLLFSPQTARPAACCQESEAEMSDYSWIPEFPPISFQARPFPRLETGPSPCFG